MNRYKKFGPLKIIFFLLAATAFIFLCGVIIMWLWNAILPEITSAQPVNFWQAIGLLILCKILFGGWHRNMGRNGFGRSRRWKQKWQQMSPDERAEFKARWRARCGPKGMTDDEGRMSE